MKISEILPDKNQPRKYFGVEKMASLRDSIKKHGIITPLIVQKDSKSGKYLLIDGERRYRAATELGLKEVPIQEVSPKNDFLRLVEQFHIQEQHESWTATEKAMAIVEISEISKKPLKEVCELLSIDERQARYYQAFAMLQNKERFVESGVNLQNAEKIGEVKRFAKRVTEEVLSAPFTKQEENKLEKVLIQKIKDKEITERADYSRIKDSFRTDPKLIDKFINEKFDIDRQFIESNARGAAYVRNMMVSCRYVIGNGLGFLKDPSVKLSNSDITLLKRASDVINEVLKLIE